MNTIDETGAANLFILARGRGGPAQIEDRDALVSLLREFAMRGVVAGLEKSKDLFRKSSTNSGGCKMFSVGCECDCDCFLCAVDHELLAASFLQSGDGR